jgi:hypothetical protein
LRRRAQRGDVSRAESMYGRDPWVPPTDSI